MHTVQPVSMNMHAKLMHGACMAATDPKQLPYPLQLLPLSLWVCVRACNTYLIRSM